MKATFALLFIALSALIGVHITHAATGPNTTVTTHMIEVCHISGDSIALGVGAYLPDCGIDATKSIPSAAVIAKTHDAMYCIVSAGSNDPDNSQLERNLISIRMRCNHRVIWIEPANSERAEKIVREVAREFSDFVVPFNPGSDGVHPLSYKDLAHRIKDYMP